MSTVVAVEAAVAIAPLVGKRGIAAMLGSPIATVKDWRNKSLAAEREGRPTAFPLHDRYVDDRPFWKPHRIVTWAVDTRRIPPDHGIILPPDIEIWSQLDIAEHFGVDLETVRDRWMHWYTHYTSRGLEPPAKALPKPDFLIDRTPFWIPRTALDWGQQVGKLGRDDQPLKRSGKRWIAEPAPPAEPPADPVGQLIADGALFDHEAIALLFNVKINTVKMWQSPHAAGRDFPAPDGPSKLDGTPTWQVPTVIDWGIGSGRVDPVTRETVRAVGGRPRA